MKSNFNWINHTLAVLLFLLLLSCGKTKNTPEDKVEMDSSMHHHENVSTYYCPMHPEIVSDKPGTCPVCKMDLEVMTKKEQTDTLAYLIEATYQTVLSSLKAIAPSSGKHAQHIEADGYLTYNPDNAGTISARTSGRVEKLYVRYNFQRVNKGEKLLELYSPELLTAQSEFVYVLKTNDSADAISTASARARLVNLGMNDAALIQLEKTRKVNPYVPIYATSSGHVHFLSDDVDMSAHALSWPSESSSSSMNDSQNKTSSARFLREGDYVKKGDDLFLIADASGIWALFKILPTYIPYIQQGEMVEIVVEGKTHIGKVDFIEKSFDAGADFYTVRVYLECNDHTNLQIGTLIHGSIAVPTKKQASLWIPDKSVLSLGKGKSVVFIKTGIGFQAKSIHTGIRLHEWIEVTNGLSENDSIAPIASYLVDSEAFILTKE
ncbi:MAG: efflux RND transporter periplasmic adaptor subunit [Cytophagaceae bacterium]|nr:efflux RND transporter periplasmic adaptor subunit [Cytophagaceae bacterium]